MHGVQARSLTDRELVLYCANQLELTTTPLPYDFQIELVRRFNALIADLPDERHVVKHTPRIDPEAD